MDVRDPHPDGYQNQRTSSRDVPGTAEQLRQTQCTRTRSNAIVTLCKGLRGPLFQPFWDAVGGAAGLANLMAEFSLRDVRIMCRHLGRTASAQTARPERHAGLAELVRLLHEDGPVPRDPRPLRQYYQDIVPACDLDLVREWDDGGRAEWTKFQRACLFGSHREWHQKRFLEDLSSAGAAQCTSFSAESRLFRGDLSFSKTILLTLIADKEAVSQIPRDFMSAFAMPLLRRLVRRRKYDDETRDEFLNLVVRCIQVHAQALASHLEGLVRYTIQRWSVARIRRVVRAATTATKQQTELCLGRLIELMSPHRQLKSLQDIFSGLLLGRKTHVDSYQLLRLILRSARGYELDIDDDTPPALSRLRDLTTQKNLWPMRLFLHLDVADAIGLFERLSAADVTGSFLTPERRPHSSLRTVLEQKQLPGSSCGDAEIVRYLLLTKSKKNGADDPAWLARARTLIQERRKKSQEGREWQQREFWATSAMNLCVAAGDMEMLDDTILWARRFNNQPLVARGLYNASTFGTEEIRELLSAVPAGELKDGEDAQSDRVAAVTKAIATSGRILVHLMETIKMSLSQPQTEKAHWQTLLRLPKLVVDHRLKKDNAAFFHVLFEPAALGSDYLGSGAVEMVWKPTIDTLVMAEGLLSSSPGLSVQATGTYVFQKLPGRSGKVRADLTSFLLQRMKMHLGSEGLRLQMHKVVELVNGVAQSDQPWLAIPFIRDLILDGEGADSAWHRKLLSFPFLSSLPYKAASGLLYAMVDAMKERMREQNARPRTEMGDGDHDDGKKAVPRPPAIKVTTVKMMAQLLQESQIIGASATCDMLLSLLEEARHIDTLVAIVSSLLSMLKGSTYSPEIHTRVLDALEANLSPVLPRLSQRRALSEADWAAVESGEAELPDVADEKPLISLLLLHCQGYNSEVMSREARARLIALLVRVPAQSALHNARWNKVFLARNGFSLDHGERLPAAPACLEVSVNLLSRFPAHVPACTLTVLCDMALVNLDPTPGIARVTAAVKADRDLVNSNAGRHWLAQFDNPGFKALERFGLLVAASLLQRAAGDLCDDDDDDDDRGGGVTVQRVAESVLAVADRIIACQLPETFEKLVARLCSERFHSRANWLAWRAHCVPLLKTMAAKVDGLRRKRLPPGDGDDDSESVVPRVLLLLLPSSFQLRVSMLPIPYSKPPKEPAQAGEVDAFVVELAELVEWLVRRGLPYHDGFAQLKKEVTQGLNRADYACGEEAQEGAQGPTLAGYLRLELAGHLLVEAGESIIKGCGVLPEVKQMVDTWVGSENEFVRLMGIGVEKKYKVLFS
ncbi:hypothetical protein C8A00DRAFT_46483 [Chaetomidium leptoderma]|uniref:Uncharacterized protein n=1 Tax=Chaetomidium leptoderma TaxID=669021 RepID=A0AAN6VEQ0_9PEZI|nr:hypothetical protein C8A00DRAFT_46483 [Chaetomidium leptoderma]